MKGLSHFESTRNRATRLNLMRTGLCGTASRLDISVIQRLRRPASQGAFTTGKDRKDSFAAFAYTPLPRVAID